MYKLYTGSMALSSEAGEGSECGLGGGAGEDWGGGERGV